MKKTIAAILLVSPLLMSCASSLPYKPATAPERHENQIAKLDVYPEDVRTNLTEFTNMVVAWAGIIQSTEAEEVQPDMIKAVTTLDHHYFDWQEDKVGLARKLLVSPHGEGQFRTEWLLRRKRADATIADAEKFAAPGQLAIVYGIPERVDTNTVVLKYHYLRIVDKFSTEEMEYRRFGEPVTWIGK